jgi:hypothetical protein
MNNTEAQSERRNHQQNYLKIGAPTAYAVQTLAGRDLLAALFSLFEF